MGKLGLLSIFVAAVMVTSSSGQLYNLVRNAVGTTQSGLGLPTLLQISLSSGTPLPVVDTAFAQLYNNAIINENLLNFIDGLYNLGGKIECAGVKNVTGIPIFPILFGLYNGDSSDFGGQYLCQKGCTGGNCAPYNSVSDAPVSAYPFGCQCGVGSCNAKGPVNASPFLPPFTIRCDPYPACNCGSIYPGTNSTGYLCNWWNVDVDLEVKVSVSYSPTLAAIRWCTCCAN